MGIRLQSGDLLAAHPALGDPNFARTVLLVVEHTPAGAFGLVLNRETGFTLDQLVPDHPALGGLVFPVLLGGPVDHTRLHFVHALPGRIRGGSELRPGLCIGGEIGELADVITQRLATGTPIDDVRIFIGYAGWGAGQLDEELATGSWIPIAGRDDWIYAPPGEDVWQRVIASALEDDEPAPPQPHESN
jgi:putative transcriptional regulator